LEKTINKIPACCPYNSTRGKEVRTVNEELEGVVVLEEGDAPDAVLACCAGVEAAKVR